MSISVLKRAISSNNVLSNLSTAAMKTSTSMDGSDNKKTRHKLKKFLTRRPTLQAVRDKGYIKGTRVYICTIVTTDQFVPTILFLFSFISLHFLLHLNWIKSFFNLNDILFLFNLSSSEPVSPTGIRKSSCFIVL